MTDTSSSTGGKSKTDQIKCQKDWPSYLHQVIDEEVACLWVVQHRQGVLPSSHSCHWEEVNLQLTLYVRLFFLNVTLKHTICHVQLKVYETVIDNVSINTIYTIHKKSQNTNKKNLFELVHVWVDNLILGFAVMELLVKLYGISSMLVILYCSWI